MIEPCLLLEAFLFGQMMGLKSRGRIGMQVAEEKAVRHV